MSNLFRKTFQKEGTFQALYECEKWLSFYGYSYGSTDISSYVGVAKGDCYIAKWKNLTDSERKELDGYITGDFRNGPVSLILKNYDLEEKEYFILSVTHSTKQNKHIQFFGQYDRGYYQRLHSAGRYKESRVLASPDYYNSGCGCIAVPCVIIESLSTPAPDGFFDDNGGVIVINNSSNWRVAIKNAITTPKYQPKPECQKG